MLGNAGADLFVFSTFGDASAVGPFDQIADFVRGTDKIDLSAFDANTSPGTFDNQAFVWRGVAAFSNVAGQLRYVQDTVNNRTFIQGDQDGKGVADVVIQLGGLVVLQATDFVL